MKSNSLDRFRETLLGICVFAFFAVVIACGGGGGGGTGTGTGTNTTTTSNGTNGGSTTTSTTGSTNGSLYPDQIFYGISDGTGKALYRIQPDGTQNTLFIDLPANVPNAAQNEEGDAFAFFVETDADPGPGVDLRYNLWTNSTVSTGAGAIRLTPVNGINDYWNFIFVGSVQFTPDGSKVVFTAARAEAEFGVYTVDTAGGNLVRIGNGEEAHLNLAGNKLVVTQVLSGAGEIVTFNLNGSGLARLTNNSDEDFMPQWSKDGAQIVFSTDRNSGQFDVYRMNANGSSATQVTTSSEDEYGPSLNHDGSEVAYVVLSGDVGAYGLYRRPVGAGSPVSVVLNPSVHQQAYWTPLAPVEGRTRLRSGFGGVQLGKPHRPRFERK